MTDEERKLALYCLKASSDYHSELCEECINYPNCDHTTQDDVTETIIKELEKYSQIVKLMDADEKKMEQETYKTTKYYRNLLLMYHEFFSYDELFTFTVNLFDSIADVDVKKLALVFKGIEDKIKKLEGVE